MSGRALRVAWGGRARRPGLTFDMAIRVYQESFHSPSPSPNPTLSLDVSGAPPVQA